MTSTYPWKGLGLGADKMILCQGELNLGGEGRRPVWGGVQSLNFLPQSFQRFLPVHLQGVPPVHLQGVLPVRAHGAVVDVLNFTDFLFSPLSPQWRSRIFLQLVCSS